MNLQDIKDRIYSGRGVTHQERAFFIRNYPKATAAFMVDNNPGNVRHTLAKLIPSPYTHLDFVPNKSQLAAQLDKIIDNGDTETFDAVLKNFVFITDNLPAGFVDAMRAQFGA